MLTGVAGVCAVAPRQSGLKKPRPLRTFSVQEETKDDSNATSFPKERKLSLGSLEVDRSTDHICSPTAPICKEIADLSAKLFTLPRDQSTERFTALNHQDSGSHYSSFQHQQTFWREDSGLSMGSMAFSTPFCRNQLAFASSRTPFSLETYLFKEVGSLAQNMNGNSHGDSFHMSAGGYNLSRSDMKDESYEGFNMDSLGSGRNRHLCSTPVAGATHMNNNKGEDRDQSYQSHSRGTTKATLMTNRGEELAVTGRDFKTVVMASRILLKEMEASLVKIENASEEQSNIAVEPENTHSTHETVNVAEPENTHSTRETVNVAKPENMHSTRETVNVAKPENTQTSQQTVNVANDWSACSGLNQSSMKQSLPQPQRFRQNWHYTKLELLKLSKSTQSHKPPAMWNIISKALTDCCIPEVKEYFEPSKFTCHDGSLVVASLGREQDRSRDRE